MTPRDGPPYVDLPDQSGEQAEDEFAADDQERTIPRHSLPRREAPRSDTSPPGPRDRDDFEIAVDDEEFSQTASPTAPLDQERLEELLAECGAESGSTHEGAKGAGSGLSPVPPPRAEVGPPATGPAWPTAVRRLLRGANPPSMLAIDFGTSYSSVAIAVNGNPHVLPITETGRQVLPTLVGIDERGCALVGEPAQKMLVTEPENVVMSPKRLLGRSYNEHEVQAQLAHIAMGSTEGPRGEVLLHARGRVYAVSQLCAPVLHHLRAAAREQLGVEVTDVLMTVPVSFDNDQRRALSEAAAMAGLRVKLFLEEPTAAVLANRRGERSAGLVAVYDFGGGTFDFSVVRVDGEGKLSVVTNAGDSWLGGDDFDHALASSAANAFWRQTGIEIRRDAVRWQRLLLAAERAKRELSRKRESVIALDDAALTSQGRLDLSIGITRQQLAEMSQELIQRTLDTCETALELADLQFSDLDAVYMSGGTSYMPAVMEAVAQAFGNTPLIAAPPDMAVVLGAASFAAIMDEERAEA